MNARPLPISTNPIADVGALECEVAYAAANRNACQLIRTLDLEVDDISLEEQGIHLRMIRLDTSARVGHDIEVCGSGLDDAQATRSGLYPAIARMVHADYAHNATVEAWKVGDYVKLPGVEQAFAELIPMMVEQAERTIATTRFQEVRGPRSLRVPLGLVNPVFLHDVEARTAPSSIKDDFDYGLLRRYCSNGGTAAGATRDEALLQGMLSAQEQLASGRFAVQGIALRQRRYLRRVDMATLPPQVRRLWEITQKRHAQPVHLFDISGQGLIPTYLACAEGPTAAQYCVAAGAGFTSEHAATRALRCLLQMHEFAAWTRSRHGRDPNALVQQRRQEFLSVHEGHYRKFAIQNLQEILSAGGFEEVAFGKTTGPLADTLGGRIDQLRDNFERAGMTPWYAEYQLPAARDEVICVQVLLAPFDASFLLLHGVPVDISAASLDAAANQEA